MRILVDTNVLISAILFRGRPRELLMKLLESNHELFVSSYIDREFRGKVRQKWPSKEESVLAVYQEIGLQTLESVKEHSATLRDIKDIPILSDAIFHDMDVILTGDKDFLEAGLLRPKAMSVAMLWDYLDE